jgi:hypothetical protein
MPPRHIHIGALVFKLLPGSLQQPINPKGKNVFSSNSVRKEIRWVYRNPVQCRIKKAL